MPAIAIRLAPHSADVAELPSSQTRIRARAGGTDDAVFDEVSAATVEPYLSLVRQAVGKIAMRLPRHIERGDLVAAGTEGLLDALRRHEGARDGRFIAYARLRIQGAILDELRRQARFARTSRDARCEASEDAVDPTDVEQVADPHPSVDGGEGHALRMTLEKAVASLPRREATLIQLHYCQGVSLADVAARMGVSCPRVSQLHTRALKLLRIWLAASSSPQGHVGAAL